MTAETALPSYDKAAESLRQQAKAIRRRGLIALVGLLLLSCGLIWLMFGSSFTPLPFVFDRSAFDDKNFVIDGLEVPAVIARVVERALAAVVFIYLAQILLMFLRYFWRLAEHLDLCASLIVLTEGNAERLTAVSAALLPSGIDFGRTPRSPLENVTQGLVGVLREFAIRTPPR